MHFIQCGSVIGRMTHDCALLAIVGCDKGLLPSRLHAIIWTNHGLCLLGPLGTNFSEIRIKIPESLYKKISSKMLFAKLRLFYFDCIMLRPHIWECSVWQRYNMTRPHRLTILQLCHSKAGRKRLDFLYVCCEYIVSYSVCIWYRYMFYDYFNWTRTHNKLH